MCAYAKPYNFAYVTFPINDYKISQLNATVRLLSNFLLELYIHLCKMSNWEYDIFRPLALAYLQYTIMRIFLFLFIKVFHTKYYNIV